LQASPCDGEQFWCRMQIMLGAEQIAVAEVCRKPCWFTLLIRYARQASRAEEYQ
jgi:hypothetical protein